MGFGRTALGRSFVYHAGTAVDSVGDTCGSRGGMVSWPRSWHTPCRTWYWCQATRSLRSTRIVQRMWSHRVCEGREHGVGLPPTPCSTIPLPYLAMVLLAIHCYSL